MFAYLKIFVILVVWCQLLSLRFLSCCSQLNPQRQTTEQTHIMANPFSYPSDGVAWGCLTKFSRLIPLLTFCCMSKGCLPKIEQQSTFQHEKLEKQVRSCARSCLRAKQRGQPREQSFQKSFALIHYSAHFKHNPISDV